MQHGLLPALTLLALSACIDRGHLTFAPEPANAATTTEAIYFSTSRGVNADTQDLNGSREVTKSYGRIVVSVPDNRQSGEINWPPIPPAIS